MSVLDWIWVICGGLIAVAIFFGIPLVTMFVVRRRAIDRLCSSFRFLRDPRSELFWGVHEPNAVVRFGHRRYLWTLRDAVVRGWIEQLAKARMAAINFGELPVPLVRFRHEFRTILSYTLAYDYVAGLAQCLASNSLESRRIALWLLGRSAHPFATSLVSPWMRDRDPAVRRTAAHALRRLTAFAELHSFENDPDPRVRRIAGEPMGARQAFSTRLQQFARHAGPSEPRIQRRLSTVFLREPIGPGKPPKSRMFIRQILQHIRELVRSQFKNHSA